jgi:hypothetical protein
MRKNSGAYKVLVGKPKGRRPLERPRSRWEENIKMYFRELCMDSSPCMSQYNYIIKEPL